MEHKVKSLVVLSGGQDSTTCLGVALKESEVVLAVSFDYGQKHAVELVAAENICKKYVIPQLVIDLKPVLKNMKSSALINHGDTTKPHEYLTDLPASFVPARNALFLTVAYGLAMEYHCAAIYAGMCETDYSGYPDCRHIFIEELNDALNTGYKSEIKIYTPLMWLNKADTFQLAKDVGVLDAVIDMTVTCYEGDVFTSNDWGLGCGICPACKLRAAGWEKFKANETEVNG
jgi:7-cyano-7-deazaguanine synthase